MKFEKLESGSWKTVKILICCVSLSCLSGAGSGLVPRFGAQSPISKEKAAQPKGVLALLQEGDRLYRTRRYAEAAKQFEAARDLAFAYRVPSLAGRAIGNLGGCQFAFFQYRQALASFTEAHRLVESAGDQGAAAGLEANISAIYSQLGEVDAAVQWKERALKRLTGADRGRHLAEVEIELASLRARQGRSRDALELFRAGIEEAARERNEAVHAVGWNRWGEEWLRQNQPERARRAFLEAYRIRRLNGLPLDGSYCDLARLRLVEGNYAEASGLLDRSIDLAARTPGMMPPWDAYHLRGRARLAQGHLRAALEDLRIAVRLARAWQWSGPALDSTRTGSEGVLHEIHSALIEAGNRLYLETGDRTLIAETFAAAEENRASSLRQLLQERRRPARELPPEYWEAIGRLQRAEVGALRNSGEATQEAVQAARTELVRLESALEPEQAPASIDLARIERSLDDSTVLLSFHLGAPDSWLWAVDGDGIRLYRLPAGQQVEAAGQAATRAIREDSTDAGALGADLYRMLFGALDRHLEKRERWLLALDRGMLDFPIAALPAETVGRSLYLVERHTVQIVPGAAHWQDSLGKCSGAAVADIAGNRRSDLQHGGPTPGDAENAHDAARESHAGRIGRASVGGDVAAPAGKCVGVGSMCAGMERRSRTADRGKGLAAEPGAGTGGNPAVVHFATHVLQSAEKPGYGLIALSLTPRGESELLPPLEIAHWRVHAGLVVLSGCYSAAGAEAASTASTPEGTYAVLPGAGLMGLTRAWLAAGARSVVASRWTMPDTDGEFFGAFYRELGKPDTTPARALRAAQRAMIQAGGWRARPHYWGAYFVMGNP